eukprot:4761224-Amphidinium_carterae.1
MAPTRARRAIPKGRTSLRVTSNLHRIRVTARVVTLKAARMGRNVNSSIQTSLVQRVSASTVGVQHTVLRTVAVHVHRSAIPPNPLARENEMHPKSPTNDHKVAR